MSFLRKLFKLLLLPRERQIRNARPASKRPPARPVPSVATPQPTLRAPARRYPTREERAEKARQLCARANAEPGTILKGKCYVIDGDTIVIKHTHIRLAGIDAPELDQPFGNKSKWALHALTKGQIVTAHVHCDMSYDRIVATCRLPDGRDLAGELVKQGLALDWPMFSNGKYAALEPVGVRKKLWRAHARQGRENASGEKRNTALKG